MSIERVTADNDDRYARLFDLVSVSHCCIELCSDPLGCCVVTVSAPLATKPAGAGGAGNFVQPVGGREADRGYDGSRGFVKSGPGRAHGCH